MAAESTGEGFSFDTAAGREDEGATGGSVFVKYVLYITFAAATIFLVMSVILSLSPGWGDALHQGIYPYFFVLLLAFQIPAAVGLIALLAVMFALYILFFSLMTAQTAREKKRSIFDTPVGYFAGVASAVFLVVTSITLLEEFFGTPVGGQGIDQQLHQNPLLGYTQLIYAPFVEELGFRIIPLGITSFLMMVHATRRAQIEVPHIPLKESLLAILIPGHVRKKYNVPLNWVDWAMIFITSGIFAYAHIFFGAWDWGKFIPVFITGIALAVGFMKFGAYVDIPFHWFFNGFLSIYVLDPSLLAISGIMTFWLMFVGVVSIVAMAIYARNRIRGTQSPV